MNNDFSTYTLTQLIEVGDELKYDLHLCNQARDESGARRFAELLFEVYDLIDAYETEPAIKQGRS